MRAFLFISLCLFLRPSFISAQSSSYAEGKFSVIVPPEWNRKPKLLVALNDILSSQIKELSDKRFCISCDAVYTIRFKISQLRLLGRNLIPVSDSRYHTEISFSFKGMLMMYNRQGEPVDTFTLIHPTTMQKIRNNLQSLDVGGRTYKSDNIARDVSDEALRLPGGPTEEDLLKTFENAIKTEWSKLKKNGIVY